VSDSPYPAHMLSNNLQIGASFPPAPAPRIGEQAQDSSRIAYLVSDNEQLGHYFRLAIQGCETRVEWFRSAARHLAHKRPEVASCLLISQRLAYMSGFDLQGRLSRTSSPPIIFLSDDGDIARNQEGRA
jgi:FixJ family two-component response regulator